MYAELCEASQVQIHRGRVSVSIKAIEHFETVCDPCTCINDEIAIADLVASVGAAAVHRALVSGPYGERTAQVPRPNSAADCRPLQSCQAASRSQLHLASSARR